MNHTDLISKIRQAEQDYQSQSSPSLAASLLGLRKIVLKQQNILCDEILVPVFALTAEAMRRAIGIELYDVQLHAGIVLAEKAVAEMQTGEGKTFAAAAPAILYALQGLGVHVMTVNAYLARRDFELLRPIYQLLGLSVGLLQPDIATQEKRLAYQCDITYGPGYEFGFDYLRDQSLLLKQGDAALGETFRRRLRGDVECSALLLQRGHAFAIVDEVDSVFLDEAITPLILSEGSRGSAEDADSYRQARDIACTLQQETDFSLDRPTRKVTLTPVGLAKVAKLSKAIPADRLRRGWNAYVEKALFAKLLLCRDVDYLVMDDRVLIVDEPTGRIHHDRFWQDGLHQALEAKEQVPITTETLPLARISRQRYFRLYQGLCGMTGTASGSEKEFWEGYRLSVKSVPTRCPCRRQDFPMRYFANADSKWAAIVKEVAVCHSRHQPVLIGVQTIENSELFSQRLNRAGIPHQLLNGKQDADEAAIVARAGQALAITIATNISGRGTDICLGDGVSELGGLHVIGAQRHNSPRIDRQLAGRAARQGDPGSSRFYVSAEDHLISDYAPALGRRFRQIESPSGEVHGDFRREIDRAQHAAERHQRLQRQQWFDFDGWREDALEKMEKRT